jgi:hypothetical protein
LHAAGTERADRAIHFLDTRIDIIERQRGDEGRECVRIFPADLGQAIIGNAGKFGRHCGPTDRFQWRIGKGEHLPKIVKTFHEPQTGVDIDERIEGRECRYRNVIGNELGDTVQIRPRHEMIEYIDDQSRPLPRAHLVRQSGM